MERWHFRNLRTFEHTDLADCKACLADGSRHRLIALAAALKSNEDFSNCFCLNYKDMEDPFDTMSQNLGNLTLVFLDINPRSPWKIDGTVGIPISFQISLSLVYTWRCTQELRNAILSAGPAGAQSFAAQASALPRQGD